MPAVSGVYSIVNRVNGKCYIGSSCNIHSRWNVHRHDLRRDAHHSAALQRAWNKYGAAALQLEILEECSRNKEVLLLRENHWLSTRLPEYNSDKVARLNPQSKERRAARGPRPVEVREKISAAKKGCVSPMKGRRFIDEHRASLSKSQKGSARPWADLTKARLRLASMSEAERLTFYAKRAATLRQTLQLKREAVELNA